MPRWELFFTLQYMPYTMPDPAANSLYREMGRDGDRLTLYNCLWTLFTNFLIFAMFTVHCVQSTEWRSTLHVLHTARAQCVHQWVEAELSLLYIHSSILFWAPLPPHCYRSFPNMFESFVTCRQNLSNKRVLCGILLYTVPELGVRPCIAFASRVCVHFSNGVASSRMFPKIFFAHRGFCVIAHRVCIST